MNISCHQDKNVLLEVLTKQFLKGEITLEEFKKSSDNLVVMDLRKLANNLRPRKSISAFLFEGLKKTK
jgi:heme oxygenase